MSWQWSYGVIAELAASAILLVLAIYFPWRELSRQSRLTGVSLVFTCALWILAHAIEIGFPVVSPKEVLVGIQAVLGIIALTFWLFYIFNYLGPRRLLAPPVYILSGIVPLIAILATSTNSVHGLMWTAAGLDIQNPYLPLQPTYGTVYWACMFYAAALTITGSFLIAWSVIRSGSIYSRQAVSLIIVAALPLVTAFIEVTGLLSSLAIPVGITPLTTCIGAVILIYSLPKFHLEQVLPAARDISFERIGDCILVLDKRDRVIDLNPPAEQLIGYKIADARGLSIELIWPGPSSGTLPFKETIRDGEELLLERDGKERTYTVHVSTTVDSGGRVTSKVILLSDITEGKRVDKALRDSEEKYRLLVESALETICITMEGIIKFANNRATELTGYTQEEILSRYFIDFIHPDDRQKAIERHQQRLQGLDISTQYSFRLVCKPGDYKWVEVSLVPIIWEGKPASLSFLTDITDRRRLEEERQRVARLESVGLLAGGIAHDFNNILTAILGNISLARTEAAPGSELQQSLEQAEKASQRAKHLTQQLLTFSKGGAPITKLASLKELIRDTAGFALRGSNVKCQFSIEPGLWHAEIDSGQISQVIHNLVINAQQSMPSGGSIEIKAINLALDITPSTGMGLPLEEGNFIRISVVDHGTGIPAEHREKIFDPFFTTRPRGSGLGLATSFSIARQHGGHLCVESETGSGSTFYLYLPASMETAIVAQPEKKAIRPAGTARVLVMDDEQGVREVAARMLRHIGYHDVELAADGAVAVNLYKAAMQSGQPFDAVILDLTVAGGMGGKETIRELLLVDPSVKAIVSSGYADDSALAEYRGYGFSGMVSKPYTLEELGKALRAVIG